MDCVSTEIIGALHHSLFFVIEALKARLEDPNDGEHSEHRLSLSIHPSIHPFIHMHTRTCT